VLEKRWFCKSTPTVTITAHVPASTCAVSQLSSIAPPQPPVPAPFLPPPAPPAPAPAVPPPPPAAPPALSAQPALTTTVHDTTTVCPKSPTTDVNSLGSAFPTYSTSYDSSCSCQSTLQTKVSNITVALPSTSPCLNDASGGMWTTQGLPRKRNDQEPSENSTYTPANTPIPQPLHTSGDVKKAVPATWDRVAYYTSAAPAAATGFAFLANLGDPQKSGTFD